MTKKRKLSEETSEQGRAPKVPRTSTEEGERLARLRYFIERNQNLRQIAWETRFIEEFHDELTTNGAEIDLNVCSKFLEMCMKLYDLKITILYEAILRMKHVLCGSSAARARVHEPDQIRNTSEAARAKRPRVRMSTVTQNPASLNKSPETYVASDPFFLKVSILVENRVDKMLLNNLKSSAGAFKVHTQTKAFWDSGEYEENGRTNSSITISAVELRNTRMRTTFKNYEISGTPFIDEAIEILNSDSDDFSNGSKQGHESGYMSDLSRNDSVRMESANDITADSIDFDRELDPMSFSHDVETAMHVEPDETAYNFEMMPTSEERLDYSYQALDSPKPDYRATHWKFITGNRACMRSKRRRESVFNQEITIECMSSLVKKFERVIYTNSGKRRLLTIQDCKRKNKLDINAIAEDAIFDSFFSAPSLKLHRPTCNTLMPKCEQTDHTEVNFDSELREDFQSTNGDMMMDVDSTPPDEVHTVNNSVMTTYNNNNHHYTRTITFANFKKKVINMKLFKSTTLAVVESESVVNCNEPMQFSAVCAKSKKLLREYNESTAAIFQAILHNANDSKLTIKSKFNDVQDFDIKFIE